MAGDVTACWAPSLNLYLFPDGDVRPCCYASGSLGSVRERSLLDIWNDARRHRLVEALAAGRYEGGCEGCGRSVAIEGRNRAYPALFDDLRVLDEPGEWPARIEFNLSNSCNLQCVQCNGDLSSSIRIHRERRPPITPAYDDAFFDDLRHFVPHLRRAQFAGGEPFLAAENFRAWELIADVHPGLPCNVVTNATQWNDRVADIGGRLRMGFTFSLDGITAATFEAVRVGAEFDVVMSNVERLTALARSTGSPVTVNHCLMPQNHHEFADLLLLFEARGIPVSVSVVRDPPHCSIAALPHDELVAVHRRLLADDARVAGRLVLNAEVWRREVERIGAWAAATPERMSEAIGAWTTSRILEFPVVVGGGGGDRGDRGGDRSHDDTAARAALEAVATGAVHMIEIDVSNRVTALSPSCSELFGVDPATLVGIPAHEIQALVMATAGEMTNYEVLASSDDDVDAVATFERGRIRVAMVATRGPDGWARRARILVAWVGDDVPTTALGTT